MADHNYSFFSSVEDPFEEDSHFFSHIQDEVNSHDEVTSGDSMENLLMRKETLPKQWRNSPIGDLMTSSGLFYTGFEDVTRCYSCNKVQNGWSKNKEVVDPSLHETNCKHFSNFCKINNNDSAVDTRNPMFAIGKLFKADSVLMTSCNGIASGVFNGLRGFASCLGVQIPVENTPDPVEVLGPVSFNTAIERDNETADALKPNSESNDEEDIFDMLSEIGDDVDIYSSSMNPDNKSTF
uniref:Baculoviral IAP repeat-containing protein 2-like n=1 Tax=Phallusia mammillata TaxID=59560 RepID=A0A6F9D851_9ASCI|nr:baculoviral IAP repeat-containing protein 2-like [Phallusia mammillata]